ncbi:helix-turn-helix domain-containing protein [Microbaculum marinisediminis]|uniref:Helix-turn-helix domain-containing protein n=1 Tax=Microbaculum marinisediminis TaxID=2931392 RepID=A0AAW5QSZ6_9HYPH|nr:helix-turn-helix domain-containing protein [Microbaculum sp. A6E488]MCT8970599.1 helix-turn-helix domain-containing protein [Microbaculum sp. A6E488]
MSAYLLGMGFKCDMATCARKLVLLKLIDACEEDGTRIYPAVSTIARAAQCSARQVQRELKAFVDTGLLRIVREGGRGPGSTREYAMDLDVLRRLSDVGWDALARGADGGAGGEAEGESKGDTVSPLQPDAKGDTADGGRVTGGAPKGDTGSHPTPPDPSNNPSSERERASAGDRDQENPKEARGVASRAAGTGDHTGDFVDSDLFWRGKSRWPGKMGGNLPLEIRAWEALGGHDERVLAERSIEAVVDDAKKQAGRTKWPSWLTYLKTRDWRLLAPDRRDPPAAPFVRTWSKEWWALIFRLTDRGDRLEPIAGSLRRQADGPAGLRWPRDDLPGADAAAALQPVHSGALEAWAWARWLNERGLRLDVGGKTEFWLHLPGAWPPGMDREAALAAKARADAAPKISAFAAERLAAFGLKPLTRPGLAPGDGAEILCDDGDGPRWLEVTVETADDRVIVGRDARGLRRTAPTQDPDRWRRTHDPGRGVG